MVIFLVGLVSMILMRTLRKDYARYSKEEEMDDMVRLSSWTKFCLYCLLRFIWTCAGLSLQCAGVFFSTQFLNAMYLFLRFDGKIVSRFTLCPCMIRIETWEMNTDGSRYMVMCFGRRAIHWYSPRSLALAAKSSLSPSSSSLSQWLRICTQSE